MNLIAQETIYSYAVLCLYGMGLQKKKIITLKAVVVSWRSSMRILNLTDVI